MPRGVPAAVAMIHSFSAADPTDPETIAGRWLAQGAFVYFGAVNEPFLPAFRPPRLVAALLAAEVPLVAALRQGEFEPFGFPWRLVYLGDPLYRLHVTASAQRRQTGALVESSGSSSSPGRRGSLSRLGTWSKVENHELARSSDRVGPSDWRAIAPEYADWPVVQIAPPVAAPVPPPEHRKFKSEDEKLRWCLDAAIGELTPPLALGGPARLGRGPAAGNGFLSSNVRLADWRLVLRQVRRDRLDLRFRPVFDDLLIDALGEIGALDELQKRLAQIPPEECGPRVWLALETGAMGRLARLAQEKDPAESFARALNLWEDVMRLSWPAGSPYPAQFTERVAALAAADARGRLSALARPAARHRSSAGCAAGTISARRGRRGRTGTGRKQAGTALTDGGPPSRQDLLDHMPVHVGQPPVDAVVAERQAGVIDAQQVKDGGVQVVAVRDVFDGLVRPFVARAVGHAPLDAAAGQPGGEGERVVVAALGALAARHAAELGGPDDDRVVEQAAALEVLDQGGGGFVHAGGHRRRGRGRCLRASPSCGGGSRCRRRSRPGRTARLAPGAAGRSGSCGRSLR